MKKIIITLGLLLLISLVMAACQPAPSQSEPITVIETVVVEKEGETVVETVVVEKEVEVEKEVIVEVEPELPERYGSWVDTIIFVEEPNSDSAVTRIIAGDIDVYAYNVTEPDVATRIFASDELKYYTAYGNFNDLRFMPSTTKEFEDGRLNPFFSDKIREAMNWLVDRDYIADEITGGLAKTRFVPINFASKDSALLADAIAAISLKYAHNPEKAAEVFDTEMVNLGAEKVNGQWMYNGEPVVLTALIRTEDERLEIGDYISNQLENLGFVIQRDYKTAAEASPCWLRGDPDSGCAHYYTGGWVATAIDRDAAVNFSNHYTPDGLPTPPWQAYTPTGEFYEIATRLSNSDFTSLEERSQLMAQALEMALQDSQTVWLKDDKGIAPLRPNISLASDLSGSVYGSQLWSETIKYDNKIGGSITIAMPSMMTNPWNPVAGSNWVYDMMLHRGAQSHAVVPDPFTGLKLPFRLEKAEVYIEEGLPVAQFLDWASLEFVPEISVPEDAWADWDAENQVWVTAAERFPDGMTAKSKVVMYYKEDFFDKVRWHDGSPFSIGDFVMFAIMQFDPSKEASPIFDEATIPAFETFLAAFKGWRIVSEDPFVVEYYTDAYGLDAENNITDLRAMYPIYGNGSEAPWHTIMLGNMVEANGEATYSSDKSQALEVDWMSFLAGPTVETLKNKLDQAQADSLIPYEPTLGQYVTKEEADTRYTNLQEWYRRYGHFWVNTGPFFIQKAFPLEGTVILQRYEDFPDLSTRWDKFAEAPVPEILVDGTDRVTIGQDATYDVFVDFRGEPYPAGDIDMVKYLVFDATGSLVHTGEGTNEADGLWSVTLSADLTGSLAEGSNQLAVIVVSKRALVPVMETLQFLTVP
jgi:peptide/nickel transport system substrate-binding protein